MIVYNLYFLDKKMNINNFHNSEDLNIFNKAKDFIEQNKRFVVSTVISTWGSSPRPIGSQMLVSEDKEIVGSVSGGCIEGSVIQTSLDIINGSQPRVLNFGVSDEKAWEVGLTCGGKISVYIERDFDLTFIETMPMGDIGNENRLNHFLSVNELKNNISSKFELEDISFSSGGPAKYSRIKGSDIKLGFITPLSHNFCSSCNRIRVDATGVLHQCLGQSNSLDFRKILRDPGKTDADLLENIRKSIKQKPEKHSFAYDLSQERIEGKIDRHMSLTGG